MSELEIYKIIRREITNRRIEFDDKAHSKFDVLLHEETLLAFDDIATKIYEDYRNNQPCCE